MVTMTKTAKFKWEFIKWAVGILSLYLDWRLRKRHVWRALDIIVIDMVMAACIPKPQLEPFKLNDKTGYAQTLKDVAYWHGTGRYQYGKDGKTSDILAAILKQGGTRPLVDLFDMKHGKMTSTSVALHRMYARVYGDMHEYGGANLSQRYGRPRLWMYYFIMAINLHATREMKLWNSKTRHEQHAAWRKMGREQWCVKVHQNPVDSVGDFFDIGSDIKGNYPILFGLKQSSYNFLKTADYVARYECRIGNSIQVEDFTHLEVPANKVQEVKRLLKKYGYVNLPVFALEACEEYCSHQHFSNLVSNETVWRQPRIS
jgi:hypothetical protein